ncbi:MAG: hypothetical protein K6L81_01730 [Agarilytica sp.]
MTPEEFSDICKEFDASPESHAFDEGHPVFLLAEENDLLKDKLRKVAESIHYPDCWDTAAFPSLFDALSEIGCNPSHCTKHQPCTKTYLEE